MQVYQINSNGQRCGRNDHQKWKYKGLQSTKFRFYFQLRGTLKEELWEGSAKDVHGRGNHQSGNEACGHYVHI